MPLQALIAATTETIALMGACLAAVTSLVGVSYTKVVAMTIHNVLAACFVG